MNRLRFSIVALALVSTSMVGAAGCTHFYARPLSGEDSRIDFEARTLADPGLQEFLRENRVGAADGVQAWDFQALWLVAMYFHPDLDVARAELANARAADVTAGQRPNPSVSLSPTYDTTTSPPWILGLTFDIPFETGGKPGYRRAAAAALSDAARLRLGSAAWQVRSRVRRSLLALFAATEGEARIRDKDAALAAVAEYLDVQRRAGEASPAEAGQARIALEQNRFVLHEAEKQTTAARIQLADSLGVSPSALDGVGLKFDEFLARPPDVPDAEARRRALLDRADIRAALAEYASTESELQLEIAKQYPNIHLNPGYQLDQADNKWSLGVTIELPMLNQNQGGIAEAEARRAASAARFYALQARVISESAQALAAYRASVKNLVVAETLSRELAAQMRTARGMLDAGEISRADLAQRQLEVATAALARLDADVKTQEALGALEDALQSPAASPTVTETSPRGSVARPVGLPRLDSRIGLPAVKGGFDLMAIDTAGRRLFLDAEDNGSTEVVDLAAGRRVYTIGGMTEPKWVVYRPELHRLYVANGDGLVRVFDSETYAPLRTIAFREKANNLRFDEATRELFVGVGKTFGAIGIIDTRTDAITAQIALANFPKQFEIDGDRIYVNVPAAQHVAVVDRRTKSVVATWPLAVSGNVPMALDRLHHRLFIGCEPGKLVVLDSTNGKEVARIDIAAQPDGVHYDSQRRAIFVSCGAGSIDVVTQVDADRYQFAGRVPTVEGAATSLFVPALDRLFVPVPQRDGTDAELRIYSIAAGALPNANKDDSRQ